MELQRLLEEMKIRGESRQALNSAYLELLDSISKDVTKCQPRHLHNVVRALRVLDEKDHELAQVCEKPILSRDITAFDSSQIGQIVNACLILDLPASGISCVLQESIHNGQLKLSNFKNMFFCNVCFLYEVRCLRC